MSLLLLFRSPEAEPPPEPQPPVIGGGPLYTVRQQRPVFTPASPLIDDEEEALAIALLLFS